MDYIYNDNKYMQIVKHILDNNNFTKIKEARHHGFNRLDHSLRVSYYAYKISRFFGFDYEDTARAGLLHDFFITDNNAPLKDAILSNFNHAKTAVDNSLNHFCLSAREEDIIITHMFPLNVIPPKYIEGWVVTLVDKTIAICEHFLFFGFRVKLASNVLAIFLINFLK